MQVTFVGKSTPLSERERDYASKKLQRLSRYFRSVRDASLTHNLQRGLHRVEVTLDLDGTLLRAESRNGDVSACIDQVADKLEAMTLLRLFDREAEERRLLKRRSRQVAENAVARAGVSAFVRVLPEAVYLGALTAILVLAAIKILKMSIYILMVAVIVQAILSWVNPYSPIAPLLNSLTQPFLRPLQKVVPPVANVDLSPLVLIIICQLMLMVPVAYLELAISRLLR